MTPELIFSIVPRLLPTLMLGLVALVGLLALRKSFSEVVSGTVKTMVGVLVLFAGVDLLVNAMSPIATLFGKVYASSGQALGADWVGFLGQFGVEIVLIMAFGFLVNLILARITPLKFVFLTGHILFWNAFMVTAALADGGKITGIPLIIAGSILLGIISTVFPALISKYVFELTGKKEFSIGHTTTVHSFLGAIVGKLVGDKSKSLEDVEFPEGLAFMKSMTVSTSFIMFLIYLVMGFIAGPAWAAETFTGGVVWVWYLWIVL